MFRIIFFAMFLLFAQVVKAQDFSSFEADLAQQPKNTKRIGICGGNSWDFSQIGNEFAYGLHAFIGVGFCDRFSAGLYLGGLVSEDLYDNYYKDKCHYNLTSLGVFLCNKFPLTERVKISVPIRIGYGEASYGTYVGYDDYYGYDSPEVTKDLFVAVPGVNIEVKLCPFFRLFAGVNFTLTSDSTLDDNGYRLLEEDGANRLGFVIGARFGKF